jgi:opacity protein-like surface antigen
MPTNPRATLLCGALAAAAVAAAAAPAQARPASQGYYAEAGIGATAFLGPKAHYSEVGPVLELRAGYDLFSWFSLGLRLGASTHEATVPPPPEGEHFQLYTGSAEAKLQYRYGRIGFFLDGGVGVSRISTNVLAKVGVLDPAEDYTINFAAGGGLEYQLANRHHAFGLGGQWMTLPEFDSMSSVSVRAYLRYTY